MCKVYRAGEDVRVHVDVEGKQCECPVILERGGIALIVAPIDHAIRKDIIETPGLLQVVRSLLPGASRLKLSES